ncbi:MAG: transposase, partial [Spirochaetales bacterium]
MFRKTNPQRELFNVESQMAQGSRERLKESWAEHFRGEVLSILMKSEEDFSDLYGITGRPNFSVGRMLGLCFLQELNDLTDQEALDAFSFDIRWQYALDVKAEEAYLSRRSLVEFRGRIVRIDPRMKRMRKVFDLITDTVIDKMGILVAEQRLDSTHIQSNIHSKGRLALFVDVLGVFLKSFDEAQYLLVPAHIRQWQEKESKGWFGLGTAAERKATVEKLARYMYRLLECFGKDETVSKSEAYQLLKRLFDEQCEVIEKKGSASSHNGEGGANGNGGGDSDTPTVSSSEPEAKPDETLETPEPETEAEETVTVKQSPKGGDTLQSAYDTDASYGHKGQGYSVQIAETCRNPNNEIITDYEVHGAARSDIGKASDSVDRLETANRAPDKLYADGGYPTVESAYDIIENRGIELIAPVNRGPMDAAVMGRDRFKFNNEGHVVSCPAGHPAIDHKILSNNSTERTLHAVFDGDLCRHCSMLETCPVRAPNHRVKGETPRDTKGDFRLEITPALRLRDD